MADDEVQALRDVLYEALSDHWEIGAEGYRRAALAVLNAGWARLAAVPDGAEQVVQHRVVMGTVEGMWADISDEDAARQIAETQGLGLPPWRMERRVVSIGPAEVIGHGGRSTGAAAADGQDGDGHG